MENIQIKNEDISKLQTELLMRLAAESTALRWVLLTQIATGQPEKLERISKEFHEEYRKHYEKLQLLIFAHFGHLDLQDILNPDQ